MNGPVVGGGDPFGNAQSKAASIHFMAVSRVAAVKTFEYTRQGLGGNPRSGVGSVLEGHGRLVGVFRLGGFATVWRI